LHKYNDIYIQINKNKNHHYPLDYLPPRGSEISGGGSGGAEPPESKITLDAHFAYKNVARKELYGPYRRRSSVRGKVLGAVCPKGLSIWMT